MSTAVAITPSFHMSPLTGKAEKCSARISCRYGDVVHGETIEDVYRQYEDQQGGSFSPKALSKAEELALLVHGDTTPTPLEVNAVEAQRKLILKEQELQLYAENFKNYMSYALDPNGKAAKKIAAVRARFASIRHSDTVVAVTEKLSPMTEGSRQLVGNLVAKAAELQERFARGKELKIPTPKELRKGIRRANRKAARIATLLSLQRNAVAIVAVPDTARHVISAFANGVAAGVSGVAATHSFGATAAKAGLAGYHTMMAAKGVVTHHREGVKLARKILETGHDSNLQKPLRETWKNYLKANKTNIALEAASLLPLGYWAKDAGHALGAVKDVTYGLKEAGTWTQVALGTLSSVDEWYQHRKAHELRRH